jgi:hypothetical protein
MTYLNDYNLIELRALLLAETKNFLDNMDNYPKETFDSKKEVLKAILQQITSKESVGVIVAPEAAGAYKVGQLVL